MDVAGQHERIGPAVDRAGLDRGVERVGIAILEQPGEFGIGDRRLHALDLGLDRGAGEVALPRRGALADEARGMRGRGRSEEHTSELQSLMRISYAVFCLKKKKNETAITQENDKHQQRTYEYMYTRYK